MYPARVDEKGRLKLPVLFQNFLTAFGDSTYFVTSLDGSIGRIYPVSVWYQNEKALADYQAEDDAGDNIHFNAMDLGSEAEIDSQGRLLLSTDLRRTLGIENQTVRLKAAGSRVDILSDAIYGERKTASRRDPASDMKKVAAAGVKLK